MPRAGGIYSAPPGTTATPNTTVASAPYNAFVADLVADANAARPVTAGGTGSVTAVGAADNSATSGADMASAATVNLANATGTLVNITGTVTITALGTVNAGAERDLVFQGALTFTHNATSLILPGAANITTAAGDVARMRSLGGGNWRCVSYERASGQPVATTLSDGIMPGRLAAAQGSFLADANTAVSDGWYMGNAATTNQPSATFYLYEVVTHIANLWVTQTAHGVTTAAAANTQAFRRHMQNGVWGAWYKLQLSQTEQDARYQQIGATKLQGGTLVNLTSSPAAAYDVTGIPSWVNKIIVVLTSVSFNGAGNWLVQLGNSGGIVASGYAGGTAPSSGSPFNLSTGFGSGGSAGGDVGSGVYEFTRTGVGSTTWVCVGSTGLSSSAFNTTTVGSVIVSNLDRVRFTSNSAAVGDSGFMSVYWE